MSRTVEIQQYTLHSGSSDGFHRIMRDISVTAQMLYGLLSPCMTRITTFWCALLTGRKGEQWEFLQKIHGNKSWLAEIQRVSQTRI